jgi:outer membrane protein assembly factor BamA
MPLRLSLTFLVLFLSLLPARGENNPTIQYEDEKSLLKYPAPQEQYTGPVTVKEIRLRGNTFTTDATILNYMTIKTGEVFASQSALDSAIAKSFRRLWDTQLFYLVQIYDLPRSNPEQAVVYVLVQEGEHWSASASFWYLTLRRKNLFGMGKELGLIAGVDRLGAYFHDPYLADSPFTYYLSAKQTSGLKYRLESDDGANIPDGAGFTLNSIIGSADFGLHLGDDLTIYSQFRAEHYFPYRQSPNFNFAPFGAESSHDNTILGGYFSLDWRDTNWNTRRGVFLYGNYEHGLQRLGGDFDYFKYGLEAQFYLPLPITDRTIIAGRLYLQRAYGGTPYFLLPDIGGVDGLRAPNYGHYIGPRAVLGTLELRQRLFTLPLFGVWLEGVAFVDLGRAFEENEKFSVSQLLWAAGPGLRLHLPFLGRHDARLEMGFGREGHEIFLELESGF